MGPKPEADAPCCQGFALRLIAVLTAAALAFTVTLAIKVGVEATARHARHANIELPNGTRVLIDALIARGDVGVDSSLGALLVLFALLMVPYFLACMSVPADQRGTAGGIAFRVAVHTAWCAGAAIFAAIALGLPFACL